MKTKAHLIHRIVTLFLAAAALGIGIAMNVYMNSFDHEQVAKKFSNGTRFAQITVFAPDTAGLTVDKIMYFRYKLETKLTEKSITPPNDGARLYADAFSSYVDASLASKGSRTSNVKLAYVGGDYSLFYKAYRDMPNVGNDLNHDRILLSRSAAWQLYGGEALYDYPVKIGPATFYVSGVYPDYKESAYIKDFYGDKPAAAADIKSDAGINITCYDLIMVDPVKNFAVDTVKECLDLPEGTYLLVENSKRFSLGNLFKTVPKLVNADEPLPTGVNITPEEMAARHAEKVLAVMLVVLLVVAVYPAIWALILLYRLIRLIKKWFDKLIVNKIKDKLSYS